ncbi:MAG: glutathione S-transferase family protein [Pseudomonadales bacterium]
MKLYSGPLSMFGAKTEIAAIEKGIHVDLEFVPFSLEKLYSPKHEVVQRVNPKAEVPVLIDGYVELFDSTQIFEYFETCQPEPALWPMELGARARARQIELWSDEIFFANVIALMPKNIEGKSASEIAQIKQTIAADYALANQWLATDKFFVKDFSYADIAFYSALFFFFFIAVAPGEELGFLSNWRAEMSQRTSIQKTIGTMVEYLAGYGIEATLS